MPRLKMNFLSLIFLFIAVSCFCACFSKTNDLSSKKVKNFLKQEKDFQHHSSKMGSLVTLRIVEGQHNDQFIELLAEVIAHQSQDWSWEWKIPQDGKILKGDLSGRIFLNSGEKQTLSIVIDRQTHFNSTLHPVLLTVFYIKNKERLGASTLYKFRESHKNNDIQNSPINLHSKSLKRPKILQ